MVYISSESSARRQTIHMNISSFIRLLKVGTTFEKCRLLKITAGAFSEKIRHYISCKSSAQHTFHLKYQEPY